MLCTCARREKSDMDIIPMATGTNASGYKTKHNIGVEEFTYKGHQYIRFSSGQHSYSTAGYVHDPDCPCHSKN